MPDAVPNTNEPLSKDPLNPQEAQKASDTNTFPAGPKGTAAPDTYPHADDHKGKKHHWGLWIFLIVLIVLGIVLYRRHEASAAAAKAAAAPDMAPVLHCHSVGVDHARRGRGRDQQHYGYNLAHGPSSGFLP